MERIGLAVGSELVELMLLAGSLALIFIFCWILVWPIKRFYALGLKARALLAATLSFSIIALAIINFSFALRKTTAPPPMSVPPDFDWEDTIANLGLPEIPLLPRPSASSSYSFPMLTEYCQLRQDACGSLLSLAADIVLSIRDAEFPEVAIFFGYDGHHDISPKVIIVTPAERIFPSGAPASVDRFNDTQPQALRNYSWLEFLRVMLDGREGRLRFFVIEIGEDEYVPFFAGRYSYYDLKESIETGAVRLPAILQEIRVGDHSHITVYVYEYNALRGQEPQRVAGQRPPISDLALAGIVLPGLVSE